MKNALFCLLVLISVCQLSALDASVQYSRYYDDQQNPYVEVYINIISSTLSTSSIKVPGVILTLTFEQNGQIVNYGKFNIAAPLENGKADLFDIQRFKLSPGIYTAKYEIVDMLDPSAVVRGQSELNIETQPSIGLSDITYCRSIKNDNSESRSSKNGLVIEPLAFQYADGGLSAMPLYYEIYSKKSPSNDTEDYFIHYELYGETGKGDEILIREAYKKVAIRSILPMVYNLDLSRVSSGTYSLKISLINKEKDVLTSTRSTLLRSNPALDYELAAGNSGEFENSFATRIPTDSLDYYLKSIAPIVSNAMVNVLNEVEKSKNEKSKRFFLYKYWYDQYQENANTGFIAYSKVAKAVDRSFKSGFGYGFETDRGFTFLKYGQPDDKVSIEDEPSAPPYEIWQYNSITSTKQTNVKFLFYNPTLANGDYRLLHSNCRGERNNPRWEVDLYRSALSEQEGVTVDTENMPDNLNRNARRWWNDI